MAGFLSSITLLAVRSVDALRLDAGVSLERRSREFCTRLSGGLIDLVFDSRSLGLRFILSSVLLKAASTGEKRPVPPLSSLCLSICRSTRSLVLALEYCPRDRTPPRSRRRRP